MSQTKTLTENGNHHRPAVDVLDDNQQSNGTFYDSNNPTLKDANSGDVIDYYGPCSETPSGKDQQQEQELDRQHRFENDYED